MYFQPLSWDQFVMGDSNSSQMLQISQLLSHSDMQTILPWEGCQKVGATENVNNNGEYDSND